MASEGTIQKLRNVRDKIISFEEAKILRPALGEESLTAELGPKLEEVKRRLEFALEMAPEVFDSSANQLAGVFEGIQQQLENQSKRSNPEYVAQRQTFLTTVKNQIESIKQWWPPFVTAAVETRGFLQDEGIRKEYQSTVEHMKEQAEKAISEVREQTKKAIEEAKKLADEIEQRARRTAAHVSVKEAQDQFRLAQEDLRRQVWVWSALSGLSIGGFIGVAVWLMQVRFPEEWRWHILYYTAIRVTILTAVGAVATFCLRVLRAYMHMKEHNVHRQRVANSMASFVESAVTPEQRDLVLTHLVDAVTAFGHSGLLHAEGEQIYSPKMVIDSVTRSISAPPGKAT